MKCYKHNNKDAVGTCNRCWAGLCNDCLKEFSIPICHSCNLKALNNDITNLYTTIITNLVIWIILAIFVISQMTSERDFTYNYEWIIAIIFWLYFSLFVTYWWSFINSLKDPNQIEVRINEWIIALIIRKSFKLAFSCLIWAFVWPFQLFKMIKEIKLKKETIAYINNNN